MGTGPSKQVETPPRPFDRNESRSCLVVSLKKKKKSKKGKQRDTSVLLQLIARRDWQKALIRMSLFPREISTIQKMDLYGVEWELLPLHLACALQPPTAVVSKLMEHHSDTARVPMIRSKQQGEPGISSISRGKSKRHRRSFALLAGRGSGKSFSYFEEGSRTSYPKTSPTKTLATDPESIVPSPPAKKRRGGKVAYIKKSMGKKPMTARKLFQDKSTENARLPKEEDSFGSLTGEGTTSNGQFPKRLFQSSVGDEPDRYSMVDDTASLAPSVVLSSHSLGEGSPIYSFEDSLSDDEDPEVEDGDSVDKALKTNARCLQLSPSGGILTVELDESEQRSLGGQVDFPESLSPSPWLDIERQRLDVEQKAQGERNDSLLADTAIADLDRILENADDLLPLFIACLYRASPHVIKCLLDAHPKAAQTSNPSFGMLPIHVICSNLSLPSPCPPPSPAIPNTNGLSIGEQDWSLVRLEVVRELLDAFPEARVSPSVHKNMTPFEYAQRYMEADGEKGKCLDLLTASFVPNGGAVALRSDFVHSMDSSYQGPSDENDNTFNAHERREEGSFKQKAFPVPSVIQYDDGMARSVDSGFVSHDYVEPERFVGTQLYIHIINKDWDGCRHILKEDPHQATVWRYGVNVDSRGGQLLWKRLPLHDACTLATPVDVIVSLIDAFPEALTSPDMYSGALPLHMACRYKACVDEAIMALLHASPVAAKTHDLQGCLPLHLLCMTQGNLEVVKKLVDAHPAAAWMRDNSGMLPVDYAQSCNFVRDANSAELPQPSALVDFFKTLPASTSSPKHRRERVNIISDAAGRSIMIGGGSEDIPRTICEVFPTLPLLSEPREL